MNADSDSAAIVYNVHPAQPGEHVFRVTCLISEPDPAGQVFALPAWVPGSYMVRDYARHVLTVQAESEKQPVAVKKLDKSTWRAEPVKGPLLISADIYANDLSVRGAYLDADHAFINGVCLFFQAQGKESEACVVHIAPPENSADWSVATGLQRLTGDEHGFGAFQADDYAQLIDCPVLLGPLTLGQFELAGARHVIAIVGRVDVDMERLERDMACACAVHVDMFGGTVPFERYVFLVTALHSGYGGLEHANSTALVCSRTDLPRAGDEKVSTAYRRFLGLVSHEYFHLWNVKRIKPSAFVPYALDAESYTRQLWIFEGITSYYDDLGLLRAGLIDEKSYLELLGQSLTHVYRAGGRRRQTLEDSSFDAWIKFYKQDENAPNAIVSYYRKGAMVALVLDLELRQKTGGRCSLDQVMKALWQQYGQPESRGVPEGAFEQLVEELSGLNLGDFFARSLRTTVDPPIGILLAQFGVRLHMRAAESDSDTGGKPALQQDFVRPWLGIRTYRQGERLLVRHVYSDDAGAAAGLSAHDELVALDGYRVTPDNWDELIRWLQPGREVEVSVFRRDEIRRFTIVPVTPPRDICYLSIEADVDDATAKRRAEWLGL